MNSNMRYQGTLFALITGVVMITACAKDDSTDFSRITTEQQVNPIGIENPDPSFTWTVDGGSGSVAQSAFYIKVASEPGLLAKGADMWNTGRVASDQSVDVRYAGKELQTGERYWWTVKIWDQDGKESPWAEPQFFEMGLLEAADWKDASWLSLEKDTRTSEHRFRLLETQRMTGPEKVESIPAGYFRNTLNLKGEVKEARAYICGLGYYELYINGKRIGDHVLDPAATTYDHHALYVCYDLGGVLKDGTNALGVVLGNGFYGQSLAFNASFLLYGKPAFKLLLNIAYEDGSVEHFISDRSWKASTGPIVFDNVYGGETYDARYELGDWILDTYDDAGWQDAQVVHPEVPELRSQLLPPIRKVREIKPLKIFQGANGNWIVDFGQNIAGWIRIRVTEKEGTVVRVSSAEALTRKGDAIHQGSLGKSATGFNQDDIYVCRGGGTESWEPRFTYNSFQFAGISGLSSRPSPEDITAVAVWTDLRETGNFNSSDEMLNRMVDVTKWTVLDNMHGYPEDCPAREKCGWLGDAHATAQFNLYAFDVSLLYRKYCMDIESQLHMQPGGPGAGGKMFRIPTMVAPGRRTCGIAHLDWGIAQVYVPWYLYLHTGDRRVVEEHYTDMKEMIRYYLTYRNANGIIENGLGDWCPPRWDRQNNPGAMECHPFISSTAYFYDVLGVMMRFAFMMGEDGYAGELKAERKRLLEDFNREVLEEIGDGGLWYGSQTATAMALRFGMVPAGKLEAVKKGLVYNIEVQNSGHHTCGIHGNRHLYTVLSDLGLSDLAYSVLTHPEYPSQGYILNCGLTTWPERQFEWDSGIEWDRSLNHPMQGGFAAYFYESLAGIRALPGHPGFKEFLVRPAFPSQVERVSASLECPYGSIGSSWERDGENLIIEVLVPFNARARLDLSLAPERIPVIRDAGGRTLKPERLKTGEIILLAGSYSIRL